MKPVGHVLAEGVIRRGVSIGENRLHLRFVTKFVEMHAVEVLLVRLSQFLLECGVAAFGIGPKRVDEDILAVEQDP